MKEALFKFFPFLEWIWELKDITVLRSDIIAGLTVAFILIPQSMAYAGLAGLPIEIWLYTAFIPVLVAGLFGSSRQMSTWPVTIVSLMTATALAWIAATSPEAYIVYASLLALFIWIFYLILWFLKLWVIVDFLSHPVIIGFTNAVAIITIISQVEKIFGITYEKWNGIFESFNNFIISVIQNTHIETFIYWLSSILILVFLWKFLPKLPRVLILLVIATYSSYYFSFDWKIIQDIPSVLPSFSIPFLNDYVLLWLNIKDITNLAIFAVIIWLIGFAESISVAKFVWTKTKEKVLSNRELIWQWLANISSSLFGWYWVAWSFSKTAVNLRAWAKTWFSSVITSIVVWITLIYLTPYLYHLPVVALAAVIMVAVAELIKIKPIIKAWNTEKHDWIVAIITFFLTLILSPDIEIWIAVWVSLSLALFISRSMRPRLVEVSMYKDWLYRDVELFGLKTSKHVSVLRFDWVLYFANAGYFEDKVLELISEKKKLKYVIFDLEWMADIDSSGIEILENLINRLNDIGIKVILTALRVKVITKFQSYWFLKRFWKKRIFIHVEKALDYIYDKQWEDIDLEPLEDYVSNKNWKEELWRYLIKKYVKK